MDVRNSLIRTFVPILVGLAVSLGLKFGFELDVEGVTDLSTALVTAVYYAAVRFLEVKVSPKWGWLLGKPKQPVYTQD